MPNVFDNITLRLVDSLREMLAVSYRADFCVGYFHLRGWRKIDDLIEQFAGEPGQEARVLVGMFRAPVEELQDDLSIITQPEAPGPMEMKLRETRMVESFKQQLTLGMPDNRSESGLRRLVRQLRTGKVKVKVFLPYSLHAKLYLTYNDHPSAPIKAYVGSSNLTGPGLSEQGELNVDVTDSDATAKLKYWFEERWNDQYSRDISELLAKIIEESWVRQDLVSPYLVYLKIAYHLAFEALEAPGEYQLPRLFKNIVLPFQEEAILRLRRMLRHDPTNPGANRIALVGDVVGMGKTLTATAVAKMFQDDEGGRCIVCCPPKLKDMWQSYLRQYEITGEVIPYSQTKNLAELQGRTRLLILDESHNLRNRETLAWTQIRDFITDQDAKVLLLSATPYNKHYEDMSNQLRLVLDEKADLGVRPEMLFHTTTEDQFFARFQASPRSLVAFEHSTSPDDWRDLLKLFMVRRTRGYIMKRFATFDEEHQRHYLTLSSGVRNYFPKRIPKTVTFPIAPGDPYSKLFNEDVVNTINGLCLPRYGLGGYVDEDMKASATKGDLELLENLSQAGQRLLGYCRTNLFKRLESSGYSFLLSLERHALRNLVFIYALDNNLDLPIGSQDSSLLDTVVSDADVDSNAQLFNIDVSEDEQCADSEELTEPVCISLNELHKRAKKIYGTYMQSQQKGRKQFKWVPARYFTEELRKDLLADAQKLLSVVCDAGSWDAAHDQKLDTLHRLLTQDEGKSKVLVFTQFADTARYLGEQLSKRYQMHDVEAVTAETGNPADVVRRFSPNSNNYELHPGDHQVRVLIATEVLSEGQNCQDANIVVNFDLPWAIIRLIQRAGRVDRIGQENAEVRVYSFLPVKEENEKGEDAGIDTVIHLRSRLLTRLKENLEVIGTDEHFFEDEHERERLSDIYAEKAGSLDDDGADADDVDLPSHAQLIWEQALKDNPSLEKQVKSLPDQVFATRDADDGQGVLVYFKTADGFDSLVRVDREGKIVSQSLLGILRAAACSSDTTALPHHILHHELVRNGVEEAMNDYLSEDGNLGSHNSTRRRVYERLSIYREDRKTLVQGSLFVQHDTKKLDKVIEEIYRHPLTERSRELLKRRLHEGGNHEALAELAFHLHDDGILTASVEKQQDRNPKLICSIGLFPTEEVLAMEETK